MTRRRFGHWLTTLAAGAVISVAAFGAPWAIEGRVVGVSDGDTIALLDDAKTQHKIRPAGIDAWRKVRRSANARSRTYRRSYSRSESKPTATRRTGTAARSARCSSTCATLVWTRSAQEWRGTIRNISTSRRRRIGSFIETKKKPRRLVRSGCGRMRSRCRLGSGERPIGRNPNRAPRSGQQRPDHDVARAVVERRYRPPCSRSHFKQADVRGFRLAAMNGRPRSRHIAVGRPK